MEASTLEQAIDSRRSLGLGIGRIERHWHEIVYAPAPSTMCYVVHCASGRGNGFVAVAGRRQAATARWHAYVYMHMQRILLSD